MNTTTQGANRPAKGHPLPAQIGRQGVTIVAPFTLENPMTGRAPEQRIVGRGSNTSFSVIDAEVHFHQHGDQGGEHLKLQLVAYGRAITDPMATPPDIRTEHLDLFWQLKALIEAAPELLATLKAVIDPASGFEIDALVHDVNRARAAIAKAEGRAQP